MPWTPGQFRARHNKKLSPAQAKEAAAVADAMLKRGVSESEAIATANARAEGKKPGRGRYRAKRVAKA
jgi:uncharacterized protein YdaT